MGQGSQCLNEAIHDWSGLPIIVAQENGEAAHALNERRHIGFSELLAKLNEIAFPVAELLPVSDSVGAAQNVEFRAKPLTMLASSMAWSASGTMFGQMSPQLDRLTIDRIRELVNRLVAHRDRMALQPHSTCGDQPWMIRSMTDCLTLENRDSFLSLARRSHAMSCAVTQ